MSSLLRLVAIALVAAAGAGTSLAQPARRVLHICDCPEAMVASERAGLLVALGKLGHVQGTNLDLASRDFTVADGSYATFFARELAARKVDLILVSGLRAAQGARSATPSVPIVFWRLTDPVGFGLVATLARPGGNLTGFSRAIEKLAPKRLELLHEMLPSARQFGFLFVADNPSHRRQWEEVGRAGASLGLTVRDYSLPATAWSQEQLDAQFARMRREGIEAFLLADQNALARELTELAARYRLPTIHPLPHAVTEWGGLAAYSTVTPSELADVASYADRILKGARPADLPVHEPTRVELVLNARQARALNLTFPPAFLLRASAVVEK